MNTISKPKPRLVCGDVDNKLTIRLTKADADAIVAIAAALRTDAAPFITRSMALKFALATVAQSPAQFIGARQEGAAR